MCKRKPPFFRRSSARRSSWIFPDNLMEFLHEMLGQPLRQFQRQFQDTGRQTYWSEWRNRLYCSPPQRSIKIPCDLCRSPGQVVKLASSSGRKSSNCILPKCVFLQEHVSNSISKSAISSLRFSFLKMAPWLNLDAKCHHLGIPNRGEFQSKG